MIDEMMLTSATKQLENVIEYHLGEEEAVQMIGDKILIVTQSNDEESMMQVSPAVITTSQRRYLEDEATLAQNRVANIDQDHISPRGSSSVKTTTQSSINPNDMQASNRGQECDDSSRGSAISRRSRLPMVRLNVALKSNNKLIKLAGHLSLLVILFMLNLNMNSKGKWLTIIFNRLLHHHKIHH